MAGNHNTKYTSNKTSRYVKDFIASVCSVISSVNTIINKHTMLKTNKKLIIQKKISYDSTSTQSAT